jgi:hypothetical protein
MTETSNPVIREAGSLMPLVCEHPEPEPSVPSPADPLPPEPQPAEPPPDLFPVPKLPDEQARDSLPEISHVKAG